MNDWSMTANQDPIARGVYFAIMACWAVFIVASLRRKKSAERDETKRSRVALIGIALQGAGYAILWNVRRAWFTPLLPMPVPVEIAVAVVTVAIAVFSIWLAVSAMRALGRQWAVAARLVEGHKLITHGPYRWVRNPIYTGMFGMMIATGLAISRGIAFPPAILLFGAGTVIRVRSEEKLLREAFGQELEDYARRVPAWLPGLH